MIGKDRERWRRRENGNVLRRKPGKFLGLCKAAVVETLQWKLRKLQAFLNVLAVFFYRESAWEIGGDDGDGGVEAERGQV